MCMLVNGMCAYGACALDLEADTHCTRSAIKASLSLQQTWFSSTDWTRSTSCS